MVFRQASAHGNWNPAEDDEHIALILRMEKLWVHCCQLEDGPVKTQAYQQVTSMRSMLKENAFEHRKATVQAQAQQQAARHQATQQQAAQQHTMQQKAAGQHAAATTARAAAKPAPKRKQPSKKAQAAQAAQAAQSMGYSPQQGGGGAHAAVTTYEQPTLFEGIMSFMSAELQRHRGAKKDQFPQIQHAVQQSCTLIESLCNKWKMQSSDVYQQYNGPLPADIDANLYMQQFQLWSAHERAPTTPTKRPVTHMFGRTWLRCMYGLMKNYIKENIPAVNSNKLITGVLVNFESELMNAKSTVRNFPSPPPLPCVLCGSSSCDLHLLSLLTLPVSCCFAVDCLSSV